ncbi:hypothetical protein T492DRAFT_311584 [Pavlovales sp. CCMP2436]|nr:hypothetical protein T492DRAFT_311584 [Pavlovales sp. CCMP2436]
MRARFDLSIVIDPDVYLLKSILMNEIFTRSLRFSDIVAPIDPTRGRSMIGTPPICSAMVAYRKSKPVLELFYLAAKIVAADDFPTWMGRHSDQEAILLTWWRHPELRLRVLVLPEETYCPFMEYVPVAGMEQQKQPSSVAIGSVHQNPLGLRWSTSWEEYGCLATHEHSSKLLDVLEQALPPLSC